MICNVLAAEFYNGSKRGAATLVLNRIIDGHRSKVIGFNVSGKREARQLAKQYGAVLWNFV